MRTASRGRLPARGCRNRPNRVSIVSEPSPLWNIVIKIAVEAAGETDARAIADLLLGRLEVAPAKALAFVHLG
jgi:hypothetical protein